LGLPDISGLEVIKSIRQFSKVPILVLTARTEETMVVQSLELGANDYMTKPLRQMELLARVKRMVQWQIDYGFASPLALGHFSYDYEKRELARGGEIIKLRSTENSILYELIRRSPNVVPYSVLTSAIWGDECEDAIDTLKVHIRHLREKIEEDSSHPRIILTKTGSGYYLVKPS
jgi:DNA-binding response OmpR family regulator